MSSTNSLPKRQETPTSLYQRLHNDSRKARILFRVHDNTSACLLHWTGGASTSGFSSLNPNLQALTSTAYTSIYGRMTGDTWLMGPHARKTLINHILDRPTPSTFSDDQSPWISTTSDIDWAIWEIARRLLSSSATAGTVELSVIRQAYLSTKAAEKKIQTRDEVRVNPSRLIDKYLSEELSAAERAEILRVKRRTREAAEVLYYGRLANPLRRTTSSLEKHPYSYHQSLPIFLPSKFWKSPTPGENCTWLENLRWNPQSAESVMAKLTFNMAMKSSWLTQPLHTFSHNWPPNGKGNTKWASSTVKPGCLAPASKQGLPLAINKGKSSTQARLAVDTGTLLMRPNSSIGIGA